MFIRNKEAFTNRTDNVTRRKKYMYISRHFKMKAIHNVTLNYTSKWKSPYTKEENKYETII
jgi:hypothetical protein